MLNAHDIYEIAKSYQAEITEGRQIQWLATANSLGEWIPISRYLPSVLDSVILERAPHVVGYLPAAMEATKWPRPMVMGFLQGMYLGKPLETQPIHMEDFLYWKGMVYALMVIQKLKSRLWEAEGLFS